MTDPKIERETISIFLMGIHDKLCSVYKEDASSIQMFKLRTLAERFKTEPPFKPIDHKDTSCHS